MFLCGLLQKNRTAATQIFKAKNIVFFSLFLRITYGLSVHLDFKGSSGFTFEI